MNPELLNLTNEEQFILTCLRSEFSGSGEGDFPAFDYESFDWKRVYNKSMQWGIAPLLYKIIEKRITAPKSPLKTCPRGNGEGDAGGCSSLQGNTAKIPEHFLEEIKVEYLITCVANNSVYETLAEISGVFHKAGIQFILLKGSHLAQFVYQDIGMRQMGDIDILVRKEYLLKAEELLLQMGYYYQDAKKGNLHLPYFLHPKGIKSLEVHWTITNPIWQFNIDIEGIWKRAKTVGMNGIDILVFSPEDLLLYLSLHAVYQHNLRALGLIPYCDIAATIHGYHRDIDCDQLQSRAHEWGIGKYLNLALCLSREFFGMSIPAHISQTFHPEPLNEKIVSEAKNRILSVKSEESVFANVPHLFYGGFHPNNRLAKRILFVFQTIFILPEKLAVYYALPETSKRVYFYYPVRLASLLYRFILHYSKFIIYRLTHRSKQVYGENLDLWILNPKP